MPITHVHSLESAQTLGAKTTPSPAHALTFNAFFPSSNPQIIIYIYNICGDAEGEWMVVVKGVGGARGKG